MDDQERQWHIREVVRLLLKAIKMRRLYGAAHAYSSTALEELQGSAGGFVRRYDALRLEVTREALVWEELKVYEEANREANLAYNLYVGGARQITVREGVTAGELDQLLGVLSARSDEDMAALIWQCDFKNIECICLDELTEGWSAPENLSREGKKKIEEMNAHADRVIEMLQARAPLVEGGIEHELTDSAQELEVVSEVPLASRDEDESDDDDDDEDDESPMRVPRQAVAALQNAVLDATPEKNLLALVDVVFDGLALEAAALGEANARWALEEIPVVAARRSNLRLLAQLLERYRKELSAIRPEARSAVGIIERTFERMRSPQLAEELIALATNGGAVGGPAAFVQVLRTLDAAGVATAVTAYSKSPGPELRDALNKYLTDHAALAPEEMTRLVEPHVAAETAKWALFVASKTLRGHAAEKLYDNGKSHPAKEVSDYASFLWRTSSPKGRVAAFLAALQSNNVAERVRAADALAKARDPQALEPLVKLVDDAGFVSRTPEERRAFLAALIAIGGAPALECLKRQTTRKSGLFSRKETEEIRWAAQHGLEELRARRATQTFDRQGDLR